MTEKKKFKKYQLTYKPIKFDMSNPEQIKVGVEGESTIALSGLTKAEAEHNFTCLSIGILISSLEIKEKSA